MKKIFLFIGIALSLLSCKKEQFMGSSPCYNAYNKRSVPFDMNTFDTTAVLDSTGGGGGVFPSTLFLDTTYKLMAVNPNNPHEIVYYQPDYNNGGNWNLYTYDFCTGVKRFIANSTEFYATSWANDSVLYILKTGVILKKNLNTNNSNIIFTASPSDGIILNIFCSPNGEMLSLVYNNSPNMDIIKIYSNTGNEILTLPNPTLFLGWYDNTHVLTNRDGKVYKTDILTGQQSVYLIGTYNSYKYRSEMFFKCTKTGGKFGSYVWTIYDKNGIILYTQPPHVPYGSIMTPMIGSNEKLIVGMETKEFHDGPPSYGGIAAGFYVMIMNMDGTDVREAKFPE